MRKLSSSLLLLSLCSACDDDTPARIVTPEAPQEEPPPEPKAEEAPLPPARTFENIVVEDTAESDERVFRDDDYREPLPDELKEHLFDMNAAPPPSAARSPRKSQPSSANVTNGDFAASAEQLLQLSPPPSSSGTSRAKQSSLEDLIQFDAQKRQAIEKVVQDYQEGKLPVPPTDP